MKRFLVILLTAAVMLTAVVMAASADTATTASGYICGDADGDEVVTIYDVTRIQQVLADIVRDADGMISLRGDVNQNGLDIIDASMIQRYLAELNVSAPIGTRIGASEKQTEVQTDVQTDVQTVPPTQKSTKDPDELPFVPIK